jgi:DNA mismatch repair protein MutS2
VSATVASADTLRALDFPLLLAALAGHAQTPMGRARLLGLSPSTDRERLEQLQAEVAECRDYIGAEGTLALGSALPLEEPLRLAAVAGTVLDGESLLAVLQTARVGRDVRRRLAGRESAPRLAALSGSIADLGPLIAQIGAVLDDEGEVRDDASPELAALRRKQHRLRSRLLEGLERLVRTDRLDGVLQDRLVTQRGGRFVVPVLSGRRGALPGVVHDTSSSGQTVYVEPLESVEQQNALVQVARAEQEEIQRLLAELTAHVRAAAAALRAAVVAIAELDERQAKARFAELTDAVVPELVAAGLEIRGGRHPLMIPGVRVEGDGPVPLDLEIPAEVKALVITGPNTGGKTVTLKTVALLALMAQCGLPVPAAAARLPVCPRIHADIGDEQSIIANLSTFSAHLSRIRGFLGDCPPGSLVLLDELGTGTDPAEGAALGIAVLEHLVDLGALTLVSTHHDALKAFAHGFPAALNAAMEFDGETLQPTFRLKLGLPGRSNAFDIAERLGLDKALVRRARGLLDVDAKQLDSLLRRVEGEAEALASDRQGVQRQQSQLAAAHARYEELNRALGELRQRLAREGQEAVEEALAAVRHAGEEQLAELAAELDETLRSRAVQDRRASWAARVAGAETEARRRIDDTVAAIASEAAELQAAGGGDEPEEGGAGEPLAYDDDDPTTALQRGEAVLVMPLNLRGRVARDWRPEGLDDADVEVDVHGKRLIVSRQQVRRSRR